MENQNETPKNEGMLLSVEERDLIEAMRKYSPTLAGEVNEVMARQDADETIEYPMNLEDFPATPNPMDIRDDTKRLLTFAAHDKSYKKYAYHLTRKLLKSGKTPAEILQAALDTNDDRVVRSFTESVNKQCYPKKIVWTYERRLALRILGALAVEYPGLPDKMFSDTDSPGTLHNVVDQIADALIDGIYVLGCPRDLNLSQILDLASTHANTFRKDGAE